MPFRLSPEKIRVALYVVVAFGVLGRLYQISAPLAGYHDVRQCDTAAMARNFYEGSMNIFYPQVDWRGSSPGYVESEFPIFAYTVAMLYHAFGPHEALGRALNIVVYALSALLLFHLVRRLFDERIALLAVFFYSVVPISFFFTRSFQPDALMTLGCLGGIYYFWIWTEESQSRFLALSGLGVGLAILTKPTCLFLGFPLFYLCWRKFRWQLFRKPVLWLFASVVILPALLWFSHAYNLWLSYGNTVGVLGPGTVIDAATMEPRSFSRVGIFPLKDVPWLVLGKRAFIRLLLIATPPGFLLLIVGFFTRPPRRNYLLYWWVAGFGISVWLAAHPHMWHAYYQLPIIFVTATLMAHGAAILWDTKRLSRTLMRATASALCVFALGFSIWQSRSMLRISEANWDRVAFGERVKSLTNHTELVIIAQPSYQWLKTFAYLHRTANGERLSSHPMDFYFSHRKGWSIDEHRASPQFIEVLRQRGARYFATFYPQEIFKRRPDLKAALEESHTPIDVTPRWAIYRLVDPN